MIGAVKAVRLSLCGNQNERNMEQFKIGDTVLYEGYTCFVKKRRGQKCLAIPMPMGWSYFIPVWDHVQKIGSNAS